MSRVIFCVSTCGRTPYGLRRLPGSGNGMNSATLFTFGAAVFAALARVLPVFPQERVQLTTAEA